MTVSLCCKICAVTTVYVVFVQYVHVRVLLCPAVTGMRSLNNHLPVLNPTPGGGSMPRFVYLCSVGSLPQVISLVFYFGGATPGLPVSLTCGGFS